jgi:hypothetical protein
MIIIKNKYVKTNIWFCICTIPELNNGDKIIEKAPKIISHLIYYNIKTFF